MLQLAPSKPTAPPALRFTTTHNERPQESVTPNIEKLLPPLFDIYHQTPAAYLESYYRGHVTHCT